MTRPVGQGRFSDTTFKCCSFSTSQETGAATNRHTHQFRTGTHKEVISSERLRCLTHCWGPLASYFKVYYLAYSLPCLPRPVILCSCGSQWM